MYHTVLQHTRYPLTFLPLVDSTNSPFWSTHVMRSMLDEDLELLLDTLDTVMSEEEEEDTEPMHVPLPIRLLFESIPVCVFVLILPSFLFSPRGRDGKSRNLNNSVDERQDESEEIKS